MGWRDDPSVASRSEVRQIGEPVVGRMSSADLRATQVGNLHGQASGQAGPHRLDPGNGQLDPEVHVLKTGTRYNQETAWGHNLAQQQAAA
jgi:hypothetical protein